MFRIVTVTVAGLLLLSGCDLLGPVQACQLVGNPAVRLTVISSVDGSPVAEGLTGTLQEGLYVEEMQPFFNQLLSGFSRPVNYMITVTATGFESWIMSDVRVRKNECDLVITRVLTAEMIPES